jgi:hypothetical protein
MIRVEPLGSLIISLHEILTKQLGISRDSWVFKKVAVLIVLELFGRGLF